MKVFTASIAFLLTTLLIAPLLALSQPGALDPSFGVDGIANAGQENVSLQGRNLIVQPDGKIILIGSRFGGTWRSGRIFRLNADGSVDNTWETDNYFGNRLDWGTRDTEVNSLGLQSDGKVLIAGGGYFEPYYGAVIQRRNTDGTIDESFGSNGIITYTGPQFTGTPGALIKVQVDDKILLSSDSLFRYNSNGTLDNTFGSNGVAEFVSKVEVLDIQPDGKIIIGRTVSNEFQIMRCNANGTLDNSFGVSGLSSVSFSGSADMNSLDLLPDGKILASGYSYTGTRVAPTIVRFNANGSIDNTFGTDGIFVRNISVDEDDISDDVFVRTDGSFICIASSSQLRVLPFDANGNFDTSFGPSGFSLLQTDQSMNPENMFQGGSLLPDGKLLVLSTSDYNVPMFYNAYGVFKYFTNFNTSLEEHPKSTQFNAFPNPTNGLINIQLDISATAVHQLSIKNLVGQTVFSEKVDNASGIYQKSLQLDFPSGIYFIRLHTDYGLIAKKINLNN